MSVIAGKYKRLGKNSLLVFIGSIGSKLMAVLMLPFYTAWLSVREYGDVDLISTYVSLIMGVVTLCITDAIFRFPQGKKKQAQRIYFSSGISVVAVSLITFGIIYFALLHSLQNIQWGVLGNYSIYIYILLIFSFLQLYLQQFSRSIDRMSVFVLSGIILTTVTVLVSFILVPIWGIDGYILSQLIGFLVASSYTIIATHAYSYFSYKYVSVRAVKEMLSYSIPMIPNATLWWILGTSNRLFLEYYHSTESVGIFAVSNRFPSVITMVFNTFFLSWQMSVLEEFEKPDFRQFYNRVLKLCFIVLTGIGFLLCLFSYWLVSFLADPAYLDAWRYIPFLGIAAIFSSLSTLMGTMFMATKATRYFLTTSFWGGMVCLILNFLLIPYFGIMGATISLLIAHFIIMCLRTVRSEQFVQLDDKNTYLLQILILIVAAFGMSFLGTWLLRLSLFLSCSFIFLFFNRSFIMDCKENLIRLLKK